MLVTETGTPKEYVQPLLFLAKKKLAGETFKAERSLNRKIAIRNFDINIVLPKILKMFEKVA